MIHRLLLSVIFVSLHFAGSQLSATIVDNNTSTREISFNRDIRPILSDKCFHCHGPDESTREADLRFDIEEGASHVIEPGDSESSEMILRILANDPDVQMPPPESHKPLKKEEIELLKKWIEQGAKFDQFWAYVAPVWHEPPNSASEVHWIDRMLESRLKQHDLTFSPQADKVTLLRRLYFDLIGLPPTPTQVDSFIQDQSANPIGKVVDELLASDHFGERLAMYWLDLVRYADTVGYHGDQTHNISPYRDWVINAFNANMKFDQFTVEQLAGDLLPNPTINQKIASGYNRLLQTTHEGGLQPKEYRAIYAADRVRNVSAVWMGATVGCAQCHDHKYDPYTAKDFYSLAAFFADIDDEKHFKSGTNALPTRRPPEILLLDDADQKAYDLAKAEFDSVNQQVAELKRELNNAKKTTSGETSERQDVITLEKSLAELTEVQKAKRQQVQTVEKRGRWTMISQPLKTPRTVRVLPRGNWLDESGPIVEPSLPEFMDSMELERRASRLDLAKWLTNNQASSGLLTARVFVNRMWYLYFGVGISKSLDDFGGQGEAPVFPELLDNLAVDFAKDWNIKRLIRQIVTTRAYQQSSKAASELVAKDPYNQLFARQSRYRLPAEMIRDSSLAISGLLNIAEIGGRSVNPYQPSGYYRHLNFPKRKYSHSTNSEQWRRGVYVHWQRQFLHPSLKALDAPSREECTCERPRSNTPLAALALLNDPCFVEASRVFAERIVEQDDLKTFASRLDFAFYEALSRSPSDEEAMILKTVYDTNLDVFQNSPEEAEALIKVGQIPVSSDAPRHTLAAWTMVARAILNLNEAITRN